MTVYPAKGNPISFQSSEGRAFFEGEEVVKINLTGGIDLQQGNLSLQVEEATYDPKTKTISSPGTVTAKGDGLELEGQGMALNLAESKMTLRKGVKTRFYPSRRSESSKRNGKG
jgi:LPS export ABC transporter protein LptC